MDRRQKEKLRFFLKARKRADKVIAKRREAERKKLDHDKRIEANKELMKQYTRKLTALAQESGILLMAEQAALLHNGSLVQEVSYYVDYGISSSRLYQTIIDSKQGELKASHLALRITWEEAGVSNEAEIRVHINGQITFHNSMLPIFPFIWRRNNQLLQNMLDRAMKHARSPSVPAKMEN